MKYKAENTPHSYADQSATMTFRNNVVRILPNHLKQRLEDSNDTDLQKNDKRSMMIDGFMGLYLDSNEIERFTDEQGTEHVQHPENVLGRIAALRMYLDGEADVGKIRETLGDQQAYSGFPDQYFVNLAHDFAHAASLEVKEQPFIEDYVNLNETVSKLYDDECIGQHRTVLLNVLLNDEVRSRLGMNINQKKRLLKEAIHDVHSRLMENEDDQKYVGNVNVDWQYHVGKQYLGDVIGMGGQETSIRSVSWLIRQIRANNPKADPAIVEKRVKSHIAYVIDTLYRTN